MSTSPPSQERRRFFGMLVSWSSTSLYVDWEVYARRRRFSRADTRQSRHRRVLGKPLGSKIERLILSPHARVRLSVCALSCKTIARTQLYVHPFVTLWHWKKDTIIYRHVPFAFVVSCVRMYSYTQL